MILKIVESNETFDEKYAKITIRNDTKPRKQSFEFFSCDVRRQPYKRNQKSKPRQIQSKHINFND